MMKGLNAYLRRTLSFALAVCMVMSMTLPAIAEGEEGDAPCTHPNAHSEPGKTATCTEKGSVSYHCDDCGAKWSMDTELAAHTWAAEPVYENEVKASCITETDGSRDAVIYCIECRARGTVTPETISWAHKWDEGVGAQATCTEDGVLTYTCTVEGCEAIRTEYPEALGHDFELISEVAPTCIATGTAHYACTRCPAVDDREIPVNPEAHTGKVDEGTVTTKPTCTETGVRTLVCDGCTESYTVVEPAAGHVLTPVEGGTPATCTEDGVQKLLCSACGVNDVQTIPALGHVLTSVENEAATCTTQGERTFTCSRCSYVHTEPVAPLGHSYNDGVVTKDPTCAEFGVKTYTCTRATCGATKTEPVALLSHDWDNGKIATPATCSQFGVKTYTCTRVGCGATKTEPVAPLGHSYNEGVVTTAPTCSAAGVKTYTCTVAGCTETKTEPVAPTGNHTFGGATNVIVASTCVAKGVGTRTCTVAGCNATETVELPMVAHNFGDTPDCADAYCVNCGYKRTAYHKLANRLGSMYYHQVNNGGAYTCTDTAGPHDDDYYDVYCTSCQIVLQENVKMCSPSGKTAQVSQEANSDRYTLYYTDGGTAKSFTAPHPAAQPLAQTPITHTKTSTIDATCCTPGKVVYTCSAPSKCTEPQKHEVAIPATGKHNMQENTNSRVAPTCTSAGSVTYTCTTQGCTATETKEIPALGHSFNSGVITTPATCTADGVMTYTCTVQGCGATTTKSIAALGHSYDNGVVTTPATCAADGVMTYSCVHLGCTAKKTQTITKTLQHTPGTVVYKVTKAPTCTETGTQTATLPCEVCHGVINARTLTLAATGHTPAASVVENRVEAKCTVDGHYDTVIYCSVSGCRAEISRTTMTLVHPGHKPAAAVVENNVDPTCEEDGNYDSVVYCSVCEEELSRKNIVVPAAGHKEAAGVRENNVEPTCTTGGGYDTVVYCSVCNKELKREHTTLPAAGHGASEMRNTRPATETAEGYTGDMVCSVCGEILTPGTAIPALASGEKVEIDPEVIMEVLNEEIKLDTAAVEDLTVLAKENGNNALELMSVVNDTMDALAQELASGQITPAEYARCVEVANVATSVALTVGAKAGSAAEEAAKQSENLPAESGLDMGAIVGDFYQRQFDAILGKGEPSVKSLSAFDGDMSGVKLILVADENTSSTGIDLSVDPEVYRNALVFIDDSVGKMTDAAATLRSCSGEAMVASVKQYIEKVAVSVFRDFDKEAADEEFLQNAYDAILLNMQQQVSTSLTEAYEEASKSGKFTGTAKTELDSRYEEQMAAVADIETFEIMVLEVMRQKYISVLNVRLENGTITREAYDAAWETAYDVESFEPIYWAIFRAWALNEESEYPMTLQELTDATIADTTYATTHIELREGLSAKETAFLTAAVAFAMLIGVAYIVSENPGKRKVVA